RALELALRQLRRQLRIDAALAGLAKIIDSDDHAARVPHVGQRAALLDEHLADGGLAFGRRLGPAVARRLDAGARRQALADRVRGGAPTQVGVGDLVAEIGARIGDEPDAGEHARVVEQRRHHHRKAALGGAGPARDLARQVAGAGDVLVLVVVLEIDLVQAVRSRPAAHELAPAGEPRPRRGARRAPPARARALRGPAA